MSDEKVIDLQQSLLNIKKAVVEEALDEFVAGLSIDLNVPEITVHEIMYHMATFSKIPNSQVFFDGIIERYERDNNAQAVSESKEKTKPFLTLVK